MVKWFFFTKGIEGEEEEDEILDEEENVKNTYMKKLSFKKSR